MLEREVAHLVGNPGVIRDVKTRFERLGFARLARETKEHYAYFSSFEDAFKQHGAAALMGRLGARTDGEYFSARADGAGALEARMRDAGGGREAGRVGLLPY